MTDLYGLNAFGSLNPEDIFRRLSLPISYIDDVTLHKNGKSRHFNYKGKVLYSPELVALTAFIEDGHSGVWSEGLAIRVLVQAFDSYFYKHLSKYFAISDISDAAIQEALNKDLINNYNRVVAFYRNSNNKIQGFDSADIRHKLDSIGPLHLRDCIDLNESCLRLSRVFKLNELSILTELIEKEHPSNERNHSTTLKLNASSFIFNFNNCNLQLYYSWLITGNVTSLQNLIDSRHGIKCNVDASVIIREFNSLLESVQLNRDLVAEYIIQPISDGDKTNPENKFCNLFTSDFAKLMLNELDFESIKAVLCKYQHVYPRWDLTILDGNTKKLRFIEVKLNDNFTSYQLRRIPNDLENGVLIELCVVRPIIST